MVGLAVDYSRWLSAKQILQSATDSAALAVAQDAMTNPNTTLTGRQTIALNVLKANITSPSLIKAIANANLTGSSIESEDGAGNFTITISKLSFSTTMMQILGNFTALPMTTSAKATTNGVVGSNKTLEMALALDNTGSMVNDMPGLRSAATTLVNTVMNAATNNNVQISVVPYVAAVNPGILEPSGNPNPANLNDLTSIDTSHANPLNGGWFQGAWLAYNNGCVQNWGSGSGSGTGSSSSGDSGSMIDMMDLVSPFRRFAEELFLTKSANAQTASAPSTTVTVSTTPPYTTSSWKSGGTNYLLPNGFSGVANAGSSTGGCAWLTNPATVNVYELFARTLDTSGNPVHWKGCVEARLGKNEIARINSLWGSSYTANSDYDVTDYPPTAGDNLSLFVPYFAPDESDYNYSTWAYSAPGATATNQFHNNYLPDLMGQSSWIASYDKTSAASGSATDWGWTNNQWSGSQNLLNYNKQNKAAIISESGGGWTYGPNAYCPDPIQTLTTSSTTVLNKISNLNYWYGSGTNIAEGLTWAWRTLSPNKPFAMGRAYGTANNQKVIVLMTDGVNGLAENGDTNGAPESDFNAFGYLGNYRLQQLANVPTASTAALTVPTPPSDATPPVAYGSVTTYDAVQTFFDSRMLQACANAKAQGITIYTVLFNHSSSNALTASQQAHSLALLQQCASNTNYTYLATDAAALNSAFAQIGSSVTNAAVHLIK